MPFINSCYRTRVQIVLFVCFSPFLHWLPFGRNIFKKTERQTKKRININRAMVENVSLLLWSQKNMLPLHWSVAYDKGDCPPRNAVVFDCLTHSSVKNKNLFTRSLVGLSPILATEVILPDKKHCFKICWLASTHHPGLETSGSHWFII